VLAYVYWHRPAAGVERDAYEQALTRFHRSLAHQPPCGLRGSAAVRCEGLPWLAGDGPAYEDWYVVEDWAAVGVLEEAAVARGHATAHEAIAKRTGDGSGAVYRLLEGSAQSQDAPAATWIDAPPPADVQRPSLDALLGDGIDPTAREAPAGAAVSRLPSGWRARTVGREPVLAREV
jgi:hypothetical protein